MPYYIWKRKNKITGYAYSKEHRPAPAIQISDDEARALGIYVSEPDETTHDTPAPSVESLQAENDKLRAQIGVLQTQQTFLEDCILEMADVVYA